MVEVNQIIKLHYPHYLHLTSSLGAELQFSRNVEVMKRVTRYHVNRPDYEHLQTPEVVWTVLTLSINGSKISHYHGWKSESNGFAQASPKQTAGFYGGRLCGLVGSALDYRSLPPEFESRRRHIWRVFHLRLRFIRLWRLLGPFSLPCAEK